MLRASGAGTRAARRGSVHSRVAARSSTRRERRPRIAFYSHDTMGLGHMRRNLLLAQTLASSPLRPVTLGIVGKAEAGRFPLPRDGERLILPGLRKRSDGEYEAARLGVAIGEIVELRARILRAALEAFEPDLLVVDNVPRGALRELDPALEMLRAARSEGRAHTVLGLRDVLDDPEVVHRQWNESDGYAALRDAYDQVWIYGDPLVYDARSEYAFPEDVVDRIRYTGYFDLRERLRNAAADELEWAERLRLRERRTLLCLLGGGQDGVALAKAFSRLQLERDTHALIVTGPYLPGRERRRLELRAEVDHRFRVLEFVREPMTLMRDCAAVIAMGGYNTVWEVGALDKPLLVVPRVAPRLEQWIRATRLRELGLLDVLPPDRLTAEALASWVEGVTARSGRPRASLHDLVPLDGLRRVVELASRLLEAPALARSA